jgi:hypothetical protein
VRVGLSQSAPLSAFIRVPLSWYRSTTLAFFSDETSTMIRRVYTHPMQQHTQRQFCGFCGTPLSFWSEEEAEYIQLSLGSLSNEDLVDLEDLGLIPDAETPDDGERAGGGGGGEEGVTGDGEQVPSGRETHGIPWFDSIVAGSRLGNMRTSKGSSQSRDGRVKVEWEVHEWTAGDGEGPNPAKRTKQTQDDGHMSTEMEDA